MRKRIAVIGGGIIGISVAYKLIKKNPKIEVVLFEKEDSLGKHQSGRNSGVLHCGLYYKPGSLKAKLAVDGIKEITKFCIENKVNHDLCGKVVVATNDKEVKVLESLAQNGKKNGLTGLKFLTKQELSEREPFVFSKKALLVPEEGIVDYKDFISKVERKFLELGGVIKLNSPVWEIEKFKSEYIVKTNNTNEKFNILINCSGLFSDRVYNKLSRKKRPLRIIPFRGEYLKLKPEAEKLVNHLIYPVPDIDYPFLGVHFTRMISGEREVGPNAVLALKREGYSNFDFSVKDFLDVITYKGMINFVKNNFSFALNEFYSSLFLESFIKKASKLIPEINSSHVEKGNAGVRAQAMDNSGNLIMDFNIKKIDNQIHLLNAPSPGATASLAIAEYLISNYIKI